MSGFSAAPPALFGLEALFALVALLVFSGLI
jgi:hypothetical protein